VPVFLEDLVVVGVANDDDDDALPGDDEEKYEVVWFEMRGVGTSMAMVGRR